MNLGTLVSLHSYSAVQLAKRLYNRLLYKLVAMCLITHISLNINLSILSNNAQLQPCFIFPRIYLPSISSSFRPDL